MADPFFDTVESLLHFDGTDGAVSIVDVTGKPWVVVNQAQISHARAKFGVGSLLLDGTGDYIVQGGVGDYNWMHDGSTDWTLEYQLYRTADSNDTILDTGGGPSDQHGVYARVNADGSALFFIAGGYGSGNYVVGVGTAAGVCPVGEFFDFCIEVEVGVGATIYVKGTNVASAPFDLAPSVENNSYGLRLGYYSVVGGYDFGGNFDEIRLSKMARYLGNYTPATEPFPNDGPQELFPPTVTGPNDFDAIESSEAGFVVSATGGASPYTYQWYDSIAGLRTGDTTDQILFTAELSQDGATFWCVVTGSDAEFAESRHATLTVAVYVAEPIITVQPEDVDSEERYAASFTVEATDPSGTGLTYQWAEIGVGDLTGATSNVLGLGQVEISDNGRQFYCQITNENGTTISNVVTLTVTANTEVIYPGDLAQASYPSFFPCPTWEFAQTVTGHLGRTMFDSGWVRQRKRWREENSSVNLTFEMNTSMYDSWNRWMVNNGYSWFTLYLDRYMDGQALYEVRLISTMEYTYSAHDVIVVYVTGELGAATGGPPSFGPEVGPITSVITQPECQPYDCASLDGYFKTQVDTATILLEGDSGAMEYPFATTRPETYGHPSLFSAWADFFSSPLQLPNWNSNYPELDSMSGYSWYEDASKYAQCGLNQETLYGVALQGSSRQYAITPPTFILHSTRAGSGTTAVVSGHRGGSGIGINLHNNSAANWYVTTRVYGSTKYNYRKCPVSCSISLNSSGTFTMSFSTGQNDGVESGSISIETGNPHQWFMVSFGEGSEFELLQEDPYDFRIWGNVTASVTAQDGASATGSLRGFSRSTTSPGTGSYIDHENRAPRTFYEAPYFLRAGDNRKCNIAYLAHGGLAVNTEEIRLKFFQNFTNYAPPPYCGT